MRIRAELAVVAAAILPVTLIMPGSAGAASDVASSPGLASTSDPAATGNVSSLGGMAAPRAFGKRLGEAPTSVTLPTGDRVLLRPTADGQSSAALVGTPSGGAAQLIRTPRGSYVFPRSVQSLIGATLDPEPFNARAVGARAGGRTPVTITYASASAPTAVAGVEVRNRRGLTGSGYITPASSAALGKALSTTPAAKLFQGVNAIRTAAASVPTPKWPMHTLTIRTLDPQGKPFSGLAFVLGIDDPTKTPGFATIEWGVGKISVAAGTYAVVTSANSKDWSDVRIVVTPEFSIASPTTVTADARKATNPVRTTFDQTVSSATIITSLTKVVSAHGNEVGVDYGFITDAATTLKATPTSGPLHGTQNLSQAVWADGARAGETYNVYGEVSGRIPTTPIVFRSTAANRATYKSTFHVPADLSRSMLMTQVVGARGGWSFGTRLPARALTRHVGAGAGLTNEAELTVVADWDNNTALGWAQMPSQSPKPGSTIPDVWLKAPAHGRFFTESLGWFGKVCPSCVADGAIGLLQLPFGDTSAHHVTNADVINGVPQVGFALKADGRVIASSSSDFLNVIANYPKGTKVISAEQTARRTAAPFKAKTTLKTEISTPLSAAIAKPRDLPCDVGAACQILPFLSADYTSTANLDNALNVGPERIGVTVNQIGRSAAVGVSSVKGWVSYDGGSSWVAASAKGSGATRTLGFTVPATARSVSLKLSATDLAGSSLTETVTNAFLVTK